MIDSSYTQMGREVMEGLLFLASSLLPLLGRGKEADSAASTNGSFPIPLVGQVGWVASGCKEKKSPFTGL